MTFTADTPGERLDAFLARVADMSRSAAQKLIEQGNVLKNGKKPKKNDRLEPGDTIEVEIPEPVAVDIQPTEMDLQIVYEDDDVLVINKPKGLVVHPAAGHQDDTLVNGLMHAMGDNLSGINGELRPGIVHRIDKDTSGLLAVAKNDYAHTMLASQLKDHSMARTYECIVCGSFREDSGTVTPPSDGTPVTARKCASPSATPATPSPTGRSSSATGATPTSAASWKPAAPTRSVSTWRTSATPSWAIRSTATKRRSWARRASASTPAPSASATPGTADPCWSSHPCPIISPRSSKNWSGWDNRL